MNLLQTIKTIEAVARKQPAVKGITPNNVYDLNNEPDAKYGNFAWVQGVHREDFAAGIRTFSFSLFYIDRLLNGRANKNEIQSTGIEVLGNVLKGITGPELWFDGEVSYQVFNERFADECSGVYCTVALKTYADDLCEEIY